MWLGETTVRLPPDLLIRARRKAAADGRMLTPLIEGGLSLAMASEPRQRPARRLPRIGEAAGGPMPGISLDHRPGQQEPTTSTTFTGAAGLGLSGNICATG